MAVREKAVRKTLAGMKDPELCPDLVVLGLVYNLKVTEASVTATISLTPPLCPVAEQIVDNARQAIEVMEGVERVEVELTFSPAWPPGGISPLNGGSRDW